MGDYAVRMQFDIDADPGTIMKALTTTDGLEQWWSRPVEGSPGEDGGEFRISFPSVPQPFEFSVHREGDRGVTWKTLAFPPWWTDTTIHWQVDDREDGPGSQLHFTHDGFDPDNAIIPVVTPGWAKFLFALVEHLEADG